MSAPIRRTYGPHVDIARFTADALEPLETVEFLFEIDRRLGLSIPGLVRGEI